MLELKNHNGEITISQTVFANIVGNVINNCYGVVEMCIRDSGRPILIQ